MARRWSSSSSRLCSGGVVGREARRRPDFNAVQGEERSSRWRPHGGALTVEDGRTMLLSDAARRSSAGLRSYAEGRRRRGRRATLTRGPGQAATRGGEEERGLEWAAAAAAGFLGPAQEKRKGAWRAERRRKERGPAGLSPRRDFGKRKDLFFSLFFMDSNQSSNSN